jgi:Flp pilus assembly protein TadG
MAQMKKTAAKKAAAKPSTVQQVAKRFGITAREVRDIATAVSTAARAVTGAGNPDTRKDFPVNVRKRDKVVGRVTPGDVKSLAAKNLAKQVGEVYTAATKGKSGTQSAKLTSIKEKTGRTRAVVLDTPTKRKQGSKK